jgi:glycosyltransferase involved in cell wall biosynthesis
MRILIATESYFPNIDGGAIAQHNLALELQKNGHEICIVAPNFSFKNSLEQDSGTIINRTRAIKLPLYMNNTYHFSPFPFFRLRNIIKEFKPDIVNLCSPYPICISAYLWARKFGIPVIGSIHILPQNMISPFYRLENYKRYENYSWRYLVYFFNLVDWATIPTVTGAEMYKKHGLKTRITPISNGLKTSVFNPDNNGEYLREKFNLPRNNIVLFSGRINEEKNIEVLINAIPYIIEKIDAHFLFVGSGGEYKQRLINLTGEMGIENFTTFTDFLDWNDYPNIYSIADVFAMPSEAELQSLVTMEAVATGLPVVVVNKGALPELASNNNGLVFNPKDSIQMARCIIKILSNDGLRKEMSRNSLTLIKQHSMESVAKQFEEIYQEVIRENKDKNLIYSK